MKSVPVQECPISAGGIQFSKSNPFFQRLHSSVLSKCDLFLQVWPIFLSVTPFSKFKCVDYFFKFGTFLKSDFLIFKVWPVFLSVTYVSECDPFLTVTFFQVWTIL